MASTQKLHFRLHYLLAGLALVVAAVLWAQTPLTLDDAFISYRYARNLVQGQGLVFNSGELVEGYTNFLWVLIAALAIACKADPFAATRLLGVLSYGIGVLFCAQALYATAPQRISSLLLVAFLGMLLLPDGLLAAVGTGLETAFVGTLGILLGLSLFVWSERIRAAYLIAAGTALILLLTRLDAVLPVAAAGLVFWLSRLPNGVRSATWHTAVQFAIPALGLIIYLLWKISYYGELLPNTYYAKGGDLWSWEQGKAYLRSFLSSNPQVAAALPLAFLAAFAADAPTWRRFAQYALLTVLLRCAYVGKVGGDFMQYRFIWETYPLLICAAAIGLGKLASLTEPLWAFALVLVCLVLSAQPATLDNKFGQQWPDEMDRYAREGQQVGKALYAVLPENTVIATTLVGTLGYYTNLKIVDQWGLTDRFIAHMPVSRIVTRGHVKFAPQEYLRSRGVNLYIAHPQLCSCSQPCTEALPNVFIRVERDLCVRSWYFGQTDDLTRHFCSHPQNFVLHNIICPSS
ncbi:MAG: hypothetical protein ACRETN_14290 [Nevskiales bacterium]